MDQRHRDGWTETEIRLTRLEHAVRAGFFRMEMMMAASQADVDALTNAISDLKNRLVADDSAIQSEIATLQAQGVDVSGLQAAVSDLSSAVDATDALVPAVTPPADNGGDGGDTTV